MRTRVKKIYMIGIGGSGMSGIAEVLINLGYDVVGSDIGEGPMVQRLKALGAEIHLGHKAENVTDAGVVVKSTAIGEDNPEVQKAYELGVPVIPRAEMLAELMRLRTGIAVAGTHGKTTTTSLLAAIFDEANQDPTVIIGGRLNAYGSNARLGEGEYLIAEADESDGSFLCLFPIITVVTNVDADHLDFYSGIDEIEESFITFMNKIPFYGKNVVCGDDARLMKLLPHVKRPILTYGLGAENQLQGKIIELGACSKFEVHFDGKNLGLVTLNHPGKHNILNALGAIGVALSAGIPVEAAFEGLRKFDGVGRRFEHKGKRNGVLVIDDYGHHPAEIEATLQTARECFPDQKIVVVFQPHRFSRTQALFGDFCKVFNEVDQLYLTEIYAASESPIPGVSGMSLAQGISQVTSTKVEFHNEFDEILAVLEETLQPGDVLLTMGAGNVFQIGQRFLEGE